MGMGYSAGYAEVIEDKGILKIAPKEFKAFQKLLAKYEVSLEDLHRTIENHDPLVGRDGDDDADVEKELRASLVALQAAFKKNSGGLELGLGFHNSDDDGDLYDDINGIYWWVEGMYQLSPAGKKHRALVERKFFVHYG